MGEDTPPTLSDRIALVTVFERRVEKILLEGAGVLEVDWRVHPSSVVARFSGEPAEGWKALAAVLTHRLPVMALRRAWEVRDGELRGPY